MIFRSHDPIWWRKRGLFLFTLCYFTYVIWVHPNACAQQRSSQTTTGTQSPAVIAGGNVTIIYKEPIIKQSTPSVSPEFDSTYKMAVSFKAAENWMKAAELFSTIYKVKPDYPTLAINYSICLSKLGKDEEALAVMFAIPNSEHYQFLNFNKGITLYKMKQYSKAADYLKRSMKDYRKNDCRYWAARALLITSQYRLSSSLPNYINDTNKFISVVRSDLRQQNQYQSKEDSDREVDNDEVQNEVISRKSAAFFLLKGISALTAQLERFEEALYYALKAVDQLEGPTEGCFLEVDDTQYKDFLAHLSFLLSRSKDRVQAASTVDCIMEKIEQHNNHVTHQAVIAEHAMLIRSFYGTSKEISGLKYGRFKITFAVTINDDRGLKNLIFDSPNYLSGKGTIELKGAKTYLFERSVVVGPCDCLDIKPYFHLRIWDTSNNNSDVDLVPTIVAVE